MAEYKVPIKIQDEIQNRIDAFCEKKFPGCPCRHIAIIRGKFIYIKRLFADDRLEPVCRLTYEDDIEDMEFAIYKFSKNKYSSDEFFFPGIELVDGTIEGALLAGMEAYPVDEEHESIVEQVKILAPILELLFKNRLI